MEILSNIYYMATWQAIRSQISGWNDSVNIKIPEKEGTASLVMGTVLKHLNCNWKKLNFCRRTNEDFEARETLSYLFFPEFSIQKVKDYFNESDQNRRTADIASFTEKNGKRHFCVVKVLA